MTLDVSYRTVTGGDWKTVDVTIDYPGQVHDLVIQLAADTNSDARVFHRNRPRLGPRNIPDHEVLVGVRGEVGAILFSDDTGSWATLGDGPAAEPVYAEMEFPSRCEVPIADLEAALSEFLTTSRRPRCVRWQSAE